MELNCEAKDFTDVNSLPQNLKLNELLLFYIKEGKDVGVSSGMTHWGGGGGIGWPPCFQQ